MERKENGTVNEVETPKNITIKGILSLLMENIDEKAGRSVISLGIGDPTAYSCFHTTPVAQEAVVNALQCDKFNGYAPTVGLPQTRRAISDYLSRDLPYKLSSDDVFVTSGCTQAIDVALAMLSRPGANILLPRPCFPIYELCAAFRGLEVRHIDLLPEKGWEVDLDAVEMLADQNTVALVIINPGNPCGNVYSYRHLKEIAETAEKLKILVIADEVYGHLAIGNNPFVPMGVFGSIVPILTLGSLSKRWIVPGWRLGWFVTTDPSGILRKPKFVERIKKYFDILGGPATFIQAAVPCILEQTDENFFKETINILKHASEICCDRIKEIPCITCPGKPQGSMAVMMKLNLSLLDDISDDIDFCFKLAKEESVIILPGTAVGLKNWLRITFAVDPASLEEALGRVKAFCQRHIKCRY
ncbi:probable aminotransferase TAT2 [Ricinus communis]|uniref:Tyrosine aminotransferase, putative n=1 Tax=Ricinus communis TaxID=3988 RepID=B9SBC0_RICCO|nr:probable aminotransferase TAT2 [Ricinus communis]EEF39128.1 tyrosine aminotransferase, putative [Ricinus communis]|eukprot:XP_002523289.1 probable aminotransferase TAT2 [Ricinus communis]